VIGNEWRNFVKWEFGDFCIFGWGKHEPVKRKSLIYNFVDEARNIDNLWLSEGRRIIIDVVADDVCHLRIVGSVPDLLWNNIWPCGVHKTCCLPFLGSVPDLLWNTIWPCGVNKTCCLPFVGSVPNLLWNTIWPCGVDKTCCLLFVSSVPDLLWNTIWPCEVEKLCCLPLVGSVPDLCWNTIWLSKSIECLTQSLCVQQ